MVEVRDLAQLDAAFDRVAGRREPVEGFHFGVNSLVTNASFRIVPGFPRSGPARRGGEVLIRRCRCRGTTAATGRLRSMLDRCEAPVGDRERTVGPLAVVPASQQIDADRRRPDHQNLLQRWDRHLSPDVAPGFGVVDGTEFRSAGSVRATPSRSCR